jgi:hypothetical protein
MIAEYVVTIDDLDKEALFSHMAVLTGSTNVLTTIC